MAGSSNNPDRLERQDKNRIIYTGYIAQKAIMNTWDSIRALTREKDKDYTGTMNSGKNISRIGIVFLLVGYGFGGGPPVGQWKMARSPLTTPWVDMTPFRSTSPPV
jgi:hypothetical protein